MAAVFTLAISAFLGACLASFLISLVHNPLRSLLGRSHCDQCHQALKPRQLIPVISSLILKSRCICGHRPSLWYGFGELALALIFLINTHVFGLSLECVLRDAVCSVTFYLIFSKYGNYFL